MARLAQGRKKDSMKGTNTMFYKDPRTIPHGRKPTFLRTTSDFRPQKTDPYRVRFTVRGDLVDYPGDTYTPNGDMTTAKILFNSVISTPNARFLGLDCKDFYLETEMERYEYMLIPINIIPQDIMEENNIAALAHNGNVLVEIRKGMYGLPQAGALAYQKLAKLLFKHGYVPAGRTPGLFKHTHRPVWFSLVVDDFGVKYIGKEHALHLINCLQEEYKLTIDWEGSIFCGIKLDWDYTNRTVVLSMPGYVDRALTRFNHPKPTTPQHSPHAYTAPNYGAKIQMTNGQPIIEPLTSSQRKHIQEVVGTFLYYARALDNTMLPAIGSIATSLTTSSYRDLAFRINQFLDYAATHPAAKLTYEKSDMHLWVDTDASYLNESKARSRGGGYHQLTEKPKLPITPDQPKPRRNAPIHVHSKIIDAVMSSVQEAETGSGFNNAVEAVPERQTLDELGHIQGPTPLQFDNKSATGIMNDTVRQKRSKHMDMRFYWLRDRARQKQFHIHWKPGTENLGDYPTKHHPTKHHQEVRAKYVSNNVTTIGTHAHCKGVFKPVPRPQWVGRPTPMHMRPACH